MFAYDLVNAIQTGGGVYLNRAVRKLSAIGFPEDSVEGAYRTYTGQLRVELDAVEIMGLEFTVIVSFAPTSNLIPKYFSHAAEYLNIPLRTTRADTTPVEVGFPWTLDSISLSSRDRRIEVAAPEIKNSILQKYAKWVTKRDIVERSQGASSGRTRTSRMSEVEDGVILINFEEGAYADASKERFLYISYLPSSKGPYDWRRGTDFEEFRKFAVEKHRQAVVSGMKAAPKKNPDPF